MLYYFVEFAGSFANIALLLLFIGRLFPKKEPVSRWFYAYVALLIAGQCALSLFPDWVTQRTIYLLVGGFFLALLFYEVRPWQAVFASGAFFTLIALVEVLAMLLIGLRIPDTDILMQAGAARLVYVVFSNLIQIPLVVLISHFFSRKGNVQSTPSNSQRHDTPNNKTHVIKFRVTAEEKASLELTCKLLNLSLSTFIRRAIHNVKIEKTVIVAGGGEKSLTAVSTLLAQCSKVGGNLNQLARHFNSGGADTEQLRAKLLDELADLTAFRLNAEKVLGKLYGNAQAYRLSRKGGRIVQP